MRLTVYTKRRSTPLPDSVLGWIRQDLQEPEPEHDQNDHCTIAAREGNTIHAIVRGDEVDLQDGNSWGHYPSVDAAVAAIYAACGEG